MKLLDFLFRSSNDTIIYVRIDEGEWCSETIYQGSIEDAFEDFYDEQNNNLTEELEQYKDYFIENIISTCDDFGITIYIVEGE